MRKIALVAFAVALASGAIVWAQSPVATPTAKTSVAQPSLITDLTIRANDSALVRAAKSAVANRLREASRSTGFVINDAYVRNSAGRISLATGSAVAPASTPKSEQQLGNIEQSTTPAPPAAKAAASKQTQPGQYERVFEEPMAPRAVAPTTNAGTPRGVEPTTNAGTPRTSQNTRDIPDYSVRPRP